MFLNPFAKKEKKTSNKKKVKIIADIHEKDSMILAELKATEEIELIIQPLKIGDYQIGNTIIERKTVSDFISSMLNKRLSIQLKQMQQYEQRLLILEGKQEDLYSKINPNAIRGFIISIITNYQTPIILTTDYKDTSKYLITFAKQQIKPKIESSLHSRIPKTIQEQKQYILESFPNIGPQKAKKLLDKFKNLSNTFNASEQDLQEVLKNQSKSFRDILNS